MKEKDIQAQNDPSSDTVSNLRARWEQLEGPVQVGVVIGGVVLLALIARFLIVPIVASIGIGLLIIILFLPYWLPTVVAFMRNHSNKMAIGAVNFFAGWTFVGWWVAMIWALSNPNAGAGQTVVVNVTNTNTNTSASNAITGSAGAPQYQVGDIVNGQRFNGMSWEPVAAPAAAAPAAAPQIGDVGTRWAACCNWTQLSACSGCI